MCDAISDDEAKSVLYVLHFSEPCPQCTLACNGASCVECFNETQTESTSHFGKLSP